MPKVVSIVGYHNSGKTTLIEVLIPHLRAKGLRVGYLKHDPKAMVRPTRREATQTGFSKWRIG